MATAAKNNFGPSSRDSGKRTEKQTPRVDQVRRRLSACAFDRSRLFRIAIASCFHSVLSLQKDEKTLPQVLRAQPWLLLSSAAPQPGANWAGASVHLPAGVYHWLGFGVLVVVLLLFDFRVFHRHDRKPTLRESVGLTVFWVPWG